MRALQLKKTIRLGNKSDPFVPQEKKYRITKQVLSFLKSLNWEVKLETKNAEFALEYFDLLVDMKAIITFSLSVGMEKDWELLEGKKTSSVGSRLEAAQAFLQAGLQVGFVGEPFIPGYHSEKEFESVLKLIRSYGINRYNTYNLHLNPFVAKRLVEVPGLDIEKVWKSNQDIIWKSILRDLIQIAQEQDVILGCPDFVNSDTYRERSNTCCGVEVENPCTFNFITWKRDLLDKGGLDKNYLESTWDGIGDFSKGESHFFCQSHDAYNWQDTDYAMVKGDHVKLENSFGGFGL